MNDGLDTFARFSIQLPERSGMNGFFFVREHILEVLRYE